MSSARTPGSDTPPDPGEGLATPTAHVAVHVAARGTPGAGPERGNHEVRHDGLGHDGTEACPPQSARGLTARSVAGGDRPDQPGRPAADSAPEAALSAVPDLANEFQDEAVHLPHSHANAAAAFNEGRPAPAWATTVRFPCRRARPPPLPAPDAAPRAQQRLARNFCSVRSQAHLGDAYTPAYRAGERARPAFLRS